MTPNFDNLASLLMEMAQGVRVTDEEKLEIAEYIEKIPDANYQEIADAFGVNRRTVNIIAMELNVGRGSDWRSGRHTKLSKFQEKQVLYYWLANHHEMTQPELARWVRQQFNVDLESSSIHYVLKRAAANQVPPVELPPPDLGKGNRLKKQRSQHRNEPGSGKLPTSRSQYFKDKEPGIVPSNPYHGGYAKPPRSPGE